MSPGIGLMKRRIEDEKSAISLAISHVSKKYKIDPKNINVLETKFHADAGETRTCTLHITVLDIRH